MKKGCIEFMIERYYIIFSLVLCWLGNKILKNNDDI